MKSSTLPPVRVEPGLRAEVESLLDAGESLSDFVAECVRDGVAWRRTQDAFITRAHSAVERAVREDKGVSPAEMLARLDVQFESARRRLALRRAADEPPALNA